LVILLGDAALVLEDFVDGCISLTVTSPPYDNLRTYGGHSFDFEEIACELYRVTQDGGIVVWVVGDRTEEGDESGTSFKQALYFKEIGFKLNDTMILQNTGFSVPSFKQAGRYHQVFQYMFVLAKGYVKTFNPLRDRPNRNAGQNHHRHRRKAKDDSLQVEKLVYTITDYGMRLNVWTMTMNSNTTKDDVFSKHSAIMAEELAEDLIQSWSNEGDLILDPFAGSGTTLKAAQQLNRKWIGIEINPDYVALAKKRLTPYVQQQRLTSFPLELSNNI
jgi:DNA modification methylase